jgi:uncharacterized protein (TIGR03086 family)
MDPIERIDRATEFAAGKVSGLRPEDLGKATPCTDFDVRALVNHMLGAMTIAATAARGEKATQPEGEQFGSDPGAAYEECRRVLLSAVRRPDALEREWDLPFGMLPGSTMGTITFLENLTHGWDLAKATGQDTTLPSDLVSEAMALAVPMDDLLRTPGVCAAAVGVAPDASAQDKYIAFMGRTP